jgi:hypothetical protein
MSRHVLLLALVLLASPVMAEPFTQTDPVDDTPPEITLHVETPHDENTTTGSWVDSTTKWQFQYETGADENVTMYAPVDSVSIITETDVRVGDLVVETSATTTRPEVEEHLGKTWIKWEAPPDGVITVSPEGVSGSSSVLRALELGFLDDPFAITIVLTLIVGSVFAGAQVVLKTRTTEWL